MPKEAVCRCGRYARTNPYTRQKLNVEIRHGANGAYYSGAITCGSVWMCPVCAANISAQRREDVTEFVEKHAEARGTVVMATFTIPHTPFQQCKLLRKTTSKGFQKLVAGDPWKRQKERYGIAFIRALEVTHGDNGWHPHLHVLFFLDRDEDLDALSDWMFARWQKIIKTMGFGIPSENAWDWKIAASPKGAAEYITKIASELTHAHMKEGRNGGRSPFQILADYAAHRNERDAGLFRDYAKSFKGARQLTYSRGLRERYKVEVMDDAEAAVEPEYDSKPVAFMTGETFEELVARELDMALLILVDNKPSWKTVEQFLRRHRIKGGASPPVIDAAIQVNDKIDR